MAGLTESLSLYSKAIGLRAQRQQVLASNIANADTPGYKARDFDFQAAMGNALSAQGGLAMAQTSGRHLSGQGGGQAPSICSTARKPSQRWTETRWTWTSSAVKSPITRCNTKF